MTVSLTSLLKIDEHYNGLPFSPVMKQDGIDISGNRTKLVNEFLDAGVEFDYVITVCDESSAEQCPVFFGKAERIHWGFEDASALEGSFGEKIIRVKQIRDQIRSGIHKWLEK